MGHINILSADVIAQIKAGEVIERPVSVVKELVENSLDAGATAITIILQNGGVDVIKIIDNGEGMSTVDLPLSVQPHATSKLKQVSDLLAVHSLGFRGEALASIAAVSQVTIQTKTATDTTGIQLRQAYGQVQEISAIGAPVGTTVTVSDLFANLPVRQKFLQSSTTELRHIVRYLMHVAVAYPSVAWQIRHNDQVVLDIPTPTTMTERLVLLWGQAVREQLLPLQYEAEGLQLTGYITKPQAARSTARHQYVVINGRPVKQTSVASSVREAYGTLLPPKWQPLFMVQLTVPAHHLDVNIHPRKEEVSLVAEPAIQQAIRAAVSQQLHQQDLTYQYHLKQAAGVSILRDTQADTGTMQVLKEVTSPWDVRTVLQPTDEIIQVHKLYLIAPTTAGVVLIDQHAAHERILYEQFLQDFRATQQQPTVVDLLTPVLFETSLNDVSLFTEQLSVLHQLGFGIEPFGQQTFKITAVPDLYAQRNLSNLLQELLEDLVNQPGVTTLDHVSHKTIAYLACRTAIKAGDSLSPAERRNLLEKLSQTKTQYTCPHGRPVQVEMSLPELHRLFKRE